MAQVLWLRQRTDGDVARLAALFPRPSDMAVELLGVAQVEWLALRAGLEERRRRERELEARQRQRRQRRGR